MLPLRASLTIGNWLYEQQCVAVRLCRSQLPALDRLEVILPATVQFDAAVDDDCHLELDGGDGDGTVFTGRLTQISRTFNGLRLCAHNGGLALAHYRPTLSLERQTVGDIIDQLCDEVSVTVGRRVDGPTLALYAVNGGATASEEIARLAALAGASGAFDGEGELYVMEEGGPDAELPLRFGREIVAASVGQRLDPGINYTVIGDGAGNPSEPKGRWVTTDFLAGSGAAPGPSERRVARPEIRTSDDAQLASSSLRQRAAASRQPVRLQLWLNPEIAPGMKLRLSDMPDRVPVDECRVQNVITTFAPGRPALTEVWATGQTDTASAFGGLAGLAGGLL